MTDHAAAGTAHPAATPDWLHLTHGDAPLLLCLPHTGTQLPAPDAATFVSPWLARHDTDWWLEQLYGFAVDLGITIVRTDISRSIIDVNRDPSGASLYPRQATTALCPTTTFDGAPLYHGAEPNDADIARRRQRYFAPYHAAVTAQLARLRARHRHVVLYDAHSIRSRIPRLFDGVLPQFNIGTNGGVTCAAVIERAVLMVCAGSGHSHVLNGRFRGGWTTRHYGRPATGVHAVQMELACRGYMHEPDLDVAAHGRHTALDQNNWPSPYVAARAAPLQGVLREVLQACLTAVTHSSLTAA